MLFRHVLDDVVILVPGRQPEPFALAGGAALWRLLEQPRTTRELISNLSAGMAVGSNADLELDGLLARLADAGAVDQVPG